jgi:enamine deaminase RidA (YjgF/YER057c/UK114 family)
VRKSQVIGVTSVVAVPEKITRLNSDQLHDTPGYHHVTVVDAGRTAFLAGQCPIDPSGAVVDPDDIAAQIDQVAANPLTALAAVGATPDHVVKSVIYVASNDRTVLSSTWQRFTGSVIGPAFTTSSTLLGVACLGFDGQLVELDLIAALPD